MSLTLVLDYQTSSHEFAAAAAVCFRQSHIRQHPCEEAMQGSLPAGVVPWSDLPLPVQELVLWVGLPLCDKATVETERRIPAVEGAGLDSYVSLRAVLFLVQR